MNLEGFSKRGMELGNDPEQINKTKNDLRPKNDLRQLYLNAIKRLALQKIKNDLLFEGSLGAVIRNLSSLGLEVSKESMLKDIEIEVDRLKMGFDIDISNVNIEVPNINTENQSEIEKLKNNLGNIFESSPVQEQKPLYNSTTIPREPAIQSVGTILPVQQSIEQSQQRNQMKDKIISKIMSAMNDAGEFIFDDISIDERMSIIQNVQNTLNAKSINELQMLLSTYQEQNVQDETMHNGMHR